MFLNREDAGRKLSQALVPYGKLPGALVLALPRGGIVVGAVVSRNLNLPFDVFMTQKLCAPWDSNITLGAVAETGHTAFNDAVLDSVRLPSEYLCDAIREGRMEAEDRRHFFCGGRTLPALQGRPVLIVDDGALTGATLLATIAALRPQKPGSLTAAVPVASSSLVSTLKELVDDLVVLDTPEKVRSLKDHYKSFNPVEDKEILDHLCYRRGKMGSHRKGGINHGYTHQVGGGSSMVLRKYRACRF